MKKSNNSKTNIENFVNSSIISLVLYKELLYGLIGYFAFAVAIALICAARQCFYWNIASIFVLLAYVIFFLFLQRNSEISYCAHNVYTAFVYFTGIIVCITMLGSVFWDNGILNDVQNILLILIFCAAPIAVPLSFLIIFLLAKYTKIFKNIYFAKQKDFSIGNRFSIACYCIVLSNGIVATVSVNVAIAILFVLFAGCILFSSLIFSYLLLKCYFIKKYEIIIDDPYIFKTKEEKKTSFEKLAEKYGGKTTAKHISNSSIEGSTKDDNEKD